MSVLHRSTIRTALTSQQQAARLAQAAKDREQAQAQQETSRKGKGKAAAPSPPAFVPFKEGQRILLVGEGARLRPLCLSRAQWCTANFSYALALVKHHIPHGAALIVATAFDSRPVAEEKYDDLVANVEALQAQGVQVLFDVDAGALDKVKALKGEVFDAIVFNFPHVGQSLPASL